MWRFLSGMWRMGGLAHASNASRMGRYKAWKSREI